MPAPYIIYSPTNLSCTTEVLLYQYITEVALMIHKYIPYYTAYHSKE